jgi:hypothetical protein
MKSSWRKLVAMLCASLVAGALSAPVVASPLHPNPKCNAGGGNGSETTPADDCDPGNSGANNNGGD